jgi:hypothetical protein
MCGAGSRQGAKAGAGAGAGGRAGYFKDNGMISEMVRNAMMPDTVARRFWTTRTWSQTFRVASCDADRTLSAPCTCAMSAQWIDRATPE